MRHVDKCQFFGKGKLAELGEHIRHRHDITAVVVGVDMLTALQLATLQDLWRVAVYDRYQPIGFQWRTIRYDTIVSKKVNTLLTL